MKRVLSFLLTLVLLAGMIPMVVGSVSAEGTTYSLVDLAKQDKIKLLGRTAVNPEGTGLMCEWAGSGFQVNVSGQGGPMTVAVSNNYYSTWVIQVDGEQVFREHYKSGGEFTFSAQIPAGAHTVTVIKDSENQSLATDRTDLISMTFDGTIETRPGDKDLVIEYIGDSYTTGMGALGTYTPGVAWKLNEHSFTNSYAYQSAKALDADYMIAARAGIGLFDGVSAAQPDDDPEETIADIYPYTAGFRKSGGLYDFAKQPDLIILEIGTNDGIIESDANFTSAQWKVNLGNMIDLIQEKNPNVPIVLFAAKSYKFKLMKEVAAERNDPSIYCYFFNHQGNGTGNTTHMKGHPSGKDAYFVSQSLNSFLMEKGLVGTKAAEPTYNDYTYYISETGDDTAAGTAAAPKETVTGVLEQAQTERTYKAGDRIVINVTGTVKMIHTNGQKLGNVPMVTEDGQQVPILIQTDHFSGTKAKVLTGHISSTTDNALAYFCNDFTFKNIIFSAGKHSTNDVWDYRLYAGYNDIVFDNVTFDHEGDGAPKWQITAGQISNVDGYRPPEGAATSTVTFKNGDYTNLDFACVVLNNKIAAVAPDVAYTELPNVSCKLIIEDGAHMSMVYNRYGTMTYGDMEVVVKGGTIEKYIGTADGTSSAKKTYPGDLKFTMEGGEIFGNAFSTTGKYVNVNGDIINNISGGTIEIHPTADYDTINFGIRNSGYVNNVVNNISGGMFIIITDGTTSSGGLLPSGYYLGGQAYVTVEGDITNNISGGTFVPMDGKADNYGAVVFGTMSGNVQGTLYNNITGGTFDTAAGSGHFYFGSGNANYYYGKIVNVIGDKETGKGPTFAGGNVYLGSGYGAVGASAKPTAMPAVSECSDNVVISNTIYEGVFEKTTYFGPSTAADTANSKYSFVLGSIESNVYGGMFQSYTHFAGRAPVYGKVTTNLYGGNMTSFAGAGYAATVYDGVEVNIYGLEEYHDANKSNSYHFWAGSYGADIPVPQTAGRPSLKLTIAPEDPKSLVLKTPISALCNGKSILGDVVVEVSGGVYPEGFSIEGVTVNDALAEGFVCTDTGTGIKLSYADNVTATEGSSVTILPADQVQDQVIPEKYLATVTCGQITKYAATPEEIGSMVSADGLSVVTFYEDVETTNAIEFAYTCTVDMNGHSLYVDPAAQKNGMWILDAGTKNHVTTVKNGSITAYQVGIRLDAGLIVMQDLTVHCTLGTTLALMDNTNYGTPNVITGCTLASGGYSEVAFNYKSKDFSNTLVTIADSDLISYKSGGTANFSKQSGTTAGTITLGSNVKLYTYASGYAGSGITVDGRTLTKETNVSVSAIGKTFTGLNHWYTASEGVLNTETGEVHGTFAEATASLGEAGGTLRLLENVTANSVTVRQKVTLDLNGYTVDTKYFTCYGNVIDGAEGGEGLVKANKGIHIAGQDSYLPVYDSTAAGYRLYRYELQNLGAKSVDGNPDALKFGFRLVLANADGYNVLSATTDEAMDTYCYIGLTNLLAPISYQFRDDTLRNYAALAAADIAANGATSKAMVITLNGVTTLETGTVVSVQPAVLTAPGVNANADAATWTAE